MQQMHKEDKNFQNFLSQEKFSNFELIWESRFLLGTNRKFRGNGTTIATAFFPKPRITKYEEKKMLKIQCYFPTWSIRGGIRVLP